METFKDPIQFSLTVLRPRIKQVLELFVGEGGHGSLTEEVCKTLLLEAPPSADYDITPDEIEPACFEGGLAILSGYPDRPLYHRLSDAMAYWIIIGNCPVFDLPNMFMLDEDSTMSERKHNLEASGSPLSGSHSLWECWSEDERIHTIAMVLKGSTGFAAPWGVTIFSPLPRRPCWSPLPDLTTPPLSCLLEEELSRNTAIVMTLDNGEETKNKHALKICWRIMKDATWINIHTLPQELKVIEMRMIEGYGVRWLHDGSEFRGFLEPQMEDGHSLGWRH